MLRLARNWVLFLAGCAAVVALLTGGILWLLPKVHRRAYYTDKTALESETYDALWNILTAGAVSTVGQQ